MLPVISALIVVTSLNCSSSFCTLTSSCSLCVCCLETSVSFCASLQTYLLMSADISLPFAPLLNIFCCFHSLLGFFLGYLLPSCCLADLPCSAHISLYYLSIEHHLESAMLSKVIVFTGQSIRLRDKDCLAKSMTFIMINMLSYSSQ